MEDYSTVQCDDKFIVDSWETESGFTVSVVLFANKTSVKRYCKDVDDWDGFFPFKEGLKRLDEFLYGV